MTTPRWIICEKPSRRMRAGRFFKRIASICASSQRSLPFGGSQSAKALKDTDGQKEKRGNKRKLFGDLLVFSAEQTDEPLCSGKGDRKEALYKIRNDLHLFYSASSQLCQTFWTSSLSSNISSIFCMFFASSSFVSLMYPFCGSISTCAESSV